MTLLQLTILAFIQFIIVLVLFIYIVFLNKQIRDKTRQYENALDEKAREMSQVVEELRTTQLKLMESGKISAVASLSAGILHQISQPITAIHGFAKFLKKEMDPNVVFYKPVCLIDEQSVYLKEMLGDLMELVRHREIRKDYINVNDIIYRSINLLKDELRIQRVNWDLNLEDGLPFVYADGIHLQQIFMNIVINAMQAMGELPRGSDKFLAISTSFDAPKNEVEVSFLDTGPGISAGDQQRIFEPFYSKKPKGAGIGLTLVKDLIAEHGGKVYVESQPHKGANFIIKLPAVKTKEQKT
ncbi:MAG TPA: ATP-binding protein [Candidatus Omnitrophota bacterium]|nr:ATP-binding protein [Candidatus Omnitrophota bacterium]